MNRFPGPVDHGNPNDDLDDDSPGTKAALVFDQGRRDYDDLVRRELIAWDALLGLAVVMWLALRVVYVAIVDIFM